ncbi:MAG: hypothetical protein QNJ41_16085 [Xenococcaceae cyanobacterium MO_188.B32]|nr:hypothetical protein [Xenococcaceae cyanobacterium MO_188.B32]
MITKHETKPSNFFDKIQLLFLIFVLSLISTPSRSQSSDFLNRSEEEIRQENQRELDDKFDRVMNSAIDRIREADRRLGTPPSADEEIFLTQECREGIRSACDYLREIEQRRLRR